FDNVLVALLRSFFKRMVTVEMRHKVNAFLEKEFDHCELAVSCCSRKDSVSVPPSIDVGSILQQYLYYLHMPIPGCKEEWVTVAPRPVVRVRTMV
ncbi:MAG: hypothetical protein Q9180_009973, partial [Flavoplaca navasiana]